MTVVAVQWTSRIVDSGRRICVRFFTYNDDEILFDDDEHNQCTGNGNNKSPVVVAIAVKSKPLAWLLLFVIKKSFEFTL